MEATQRRTEPDSDWQEIKHIIKDIAKGQEKTGLMIQGLTEKQTETGLMIQGLTEKQAETDRQLKEFRASLAESKVEHDRIIKERQSEHDRIMKESQVEHNRSKAEHDRIIQGMAQENKEFKENIDKLLASQKNMQTELGGIGRSNGDFAEEYFFNCFEKGKQNFFGEKFDDIQKNIKLDGKLIGTVKAEYDIVLLNCKSVAIIEVKNKARKEYLSQLIKQAETFRINFPAYAGHQIFLAFAALSFEGEVEHDVINEGIAIIKQVGDTVVINDEHLKVY
jgi:hypothetical protein